MTNACKRKFNKGESLYVVDYWGTANGTQAFEAFAEILQVDEENENFLAVLYGDTYQRYSFKDYGRLFFDKKEEAIKAANELPKPTSIVYQLIGNKVYKKTVVGIYNRTIDGVTDLVIKLNRGKELSIKKIGSELFLNESDARKKKK